MNNEREECRDCPDMLKGTAGPGCIHSGVCYRLRIPPGTPEWLRALSMDLHLRVKENKMLNDLADCLDGHCPDMLHQKIKAAWSRGYSAWGELHDVISDIERLTKKAMPPTSDFSKANVDLWDIDDIIIPPFKPWERSDDFMDLEPEILAVDDQAAAEHCPLRHEFPPHWGEVERWGAIECPPGKSSRGNK